LVFAAAEAIFALNAAPRIWSKVRIEWLPAARYLSYSNFGECTMQALTAGQYFFVYNAFSFTLAAMIFLWLGRSQVGPAYKTALTISGLVTFIAAYKRLPSFSIGCSPFRCC